MATINFTDEQITQAYKIFIDHVNNGGNQSIDAVRALFAEKCGYGFPTVDSLMRILNDPANQKDFLKNHPEYSFDF
ncbi:hypothetical protein [Selenomonas sp. FC4001]|uniref:hypothetical protein n=1 Tax=Selenomonas sp. FC4001 TaxID=1408313 RepID=UPI00056C67F8|nr:hypothetical protein [Selenomonas sp. FC4001]